MHLRFAASLLPTRGGSPEPEITNMKSIVIGLAALATLAACDTPVTSPAPLQSSAASRSITPTWAKEVTGVTGEGAQYAVFVPTNWNGDVAYWSHGINDVAEPVGISIKDHFEEFRDSLGVMGYAVATSSYSENGWAVKDGMQKMHQLRGLFTSIAGNPRRSFLVGPSMGGLISVALAEKFPSQYDGALPMCGVLGGAQKQIDYLANVRTVFDVLYPGTLPGNALDMPAELDLMTQVIFPTQMAVGANPTNAILMARIAQTPLAGRNPIEIITSLVTAIGYDARGADDLLDRTHGHSPFFNNDPAYYTAAAPLPPTFIPAVNAAARRFDETPDAANYLEKYYNPTGAVQIPVLSIHTDHDPVVPFFHERLYKERVLAAGADQRLVQRTISNTYGHCAFQIGQMTAAFRDLAAWVETGTRPTP